MALTRSKGLDGLFEPLLSRMLDLSTYAHFNVFATPSRVLYLPLCLPEQRLQITCTAVDTLEDKVSTVIKATVSILMKLILTHPYKEVT
jgi:condensin complex subunit 1